MDKRNNLIEEVLLAFYTHDVRWKIDGRLTNPTADDIGKVLDRLAQAVYDGDENTQASTGGILVKRAGNHVDVYLHLGEL